MNVKRRKGPLVEALRVPTPRPVLQHIEAHAGDWIVTKFRALYSGDKSLAFLLENRQAVVNGLISQLWEPLCWRRRPSGSHSWKKRVPREAPTRRHQNPLGDCPLWKPPRLRTPRIAY